MIGDTRQPRIVSVSKSQKSLLDYHESGQYVPYRRQNPEFYRQAKSFFTDKEVTILLLWALIAPSAALAYLIWQKYEKLRVVAILLFAISIVQFIVQWQGVYTLARRFLASA